MEVFPSAMLTLGPARRPSSWATSQATWLEFSRDTSAVSASRALAWLSADVSLSGRGSTTHCSPRCTTTGVPLELGSTGTVCR
ncbi:hypothetical protein EYF80_038684 [Liparis tanakae]|uniref:Uncharacterized protein n=1 Tax=Liparis tanakae TaxID=230148 RepID=A0A4Z2GC22_9TELE|nr:hypothetical protein EYF80_038684 [Liparis tanakae]